MSEHEKPRIAICPGSYDPVTNGHVDIITRGLAGLRQGHRRGRGPADPQAEDAVHRRGAQGIPRAGHGGDLANVEVEVFSNLLVDFTQENGATAIVKGLRAISDFGCEFE